MGKSYQIAIIRVPKLDNFGLIKEGLSLGTVRNVRTRLLSLNENIFIPDWLVPIEDNYQALEEEFLGLKLSERIDLSTKNKVLVPICNIWLGRGFEPASAI